MTGETIQTFWVINQASKGGGAVRVTVVQPQQESDPASFH